MNKFSLQEENIRLSVVKLVVEFLRNGYERNSEVQQVVGLWSLIYTCIYSLWDYWGWLVSIFVLIIRAEKVSGSLYYQRNFVET